MPASVGKTLFITGGTGSFGNAALNRFLHTNIGEIRIFSRDEKKQDDMGHEFQVRMSEVADKIKFYVGNVERNTLTEFNSNNIRLQSAEETKEKCGTSIYSRRTGEGYKIR